MMNLSFTSRCPARIAAIVAPVFLMGAILSDEVLAQASQTTPPDQAAPSTMPSVNDASELEIDGQPPSVSAPTAPDASEQVDVDINEQERSNWDEQEQELEQELEQDQEDAPDSPPPGSVTPGQDSPDQIEIPL